MSWNEVLLAVEARLKPEDWKTFTRLHRNFVGYASEGTLSRFYGFVFSHGLHLELNGFRFRRLESILAALASRPASAGARVLEVGAGAGILAAAAVKLLAPREYVTHDLCAGARDHLQAEGFAVLPHPAPPGPAGGPFDLIVCADSLGEIHSDDDGYLRDPANHAAPEFADALEERYGFAHKLSIWKPYLAASGNLLLWEPFTHAAVWERLARYLGETGWAARPVPAASGTAPYLELSLP